MTWQDIALIVAGIVGGGAAPIHGLIVRRRMTDPIKPLMRAEGSISQPIERLIPLLLDFSAFNWFLSGVALIAAGIWFGGEARLVTGLLAGSSYLFATIANCWGTRGRHFGWVLYAVPVILVALGLQR